MKKDSICQVDVINQQNVTTATNYLEKEKVQKSLRILSKFTDNKQINIIFYLLAVNIATFFLYGIDKYKAKKIQWRISEATLLTMAAIGGSIGAWTGMRLWHHKTMHKKFKYGIPLIIILQVALAVYLLTNFE